MLRTEADAPSVRAVIFPGLAKMLEPLTFLLDCAGAYGEG